ncbi:MAG: helix-turn-helix domain-containing protein [Pseudomonadota bacterium]
MQITVALYPRFSNLCLANALEPLRAANDLSGRALFHWEVVSLDGNAVASSSGLEIAVRGRLADAKGEMLLVLPSYGFPDHVTPSGRAALRAASKRFRTLAGFDMGAWLLADAGLLDGYRATLHGDEIEAFAEAFPEVTVERARYLRDRDRFTCAGASAALEAMLELVEERGGPSLRLDVALLLIQPGAAGRPGAPGVSSRKVARLLEVMGDNLEEPLPLKQIAGEAGLSLRGLERLTREKLSTSPAALYRRLRLLRARKLAQDTDMAVTEIALRTGYADASAMTRAFRQEFGVPPRALRTR